MRPLPVKTLHRLKGRNFRGNLVSSIAKSAHFAQEFSFVDSNLGEFWQESSFADLNL